VSTEAADIRILALGDSYTIGESVTVDARWPIQLARRLEEEGWSASVEIIAETGWTTDELDAGIDSAEPVGPYDLVTLQIGVNNQFRGRQLDVYRAEFTALALRAIGLAGGDPSRVIVVSIPDWSVTPFGTSYVPDRVAGQIDAFNEANRDVAAELDVAWVDVTGISRAGGSELVADDGLHPAAEQYRQWVEEILPVARRALGSAAAG